MLMQGPSSSHLPAMYPVYHSTYDNYHWMAKFGDPGFHYHVASKTSAQFLLR